MRVCGGEGGQLDISDEIDHTHLSSIYCFSEGGPVNVEWNTGTRSCKIINASKIQSMDLQYIKSAFGSSVYLPVRS